MEEGEVCISPTKSYKGNTFTFQKKSDWGTDPVSEELGAQKEVPVPGLFLSFSRQLCQI